MMSDNIVLMSISREELLEIIRSAVKVELSVKKRKELMNFKETCELLAIHPSTLNKWKAENKIPFKKLGKRIFFNRQDVLNALKDSNYHKMKELRV